MCALPATAQSVVGTTVVGTDTIRVDGTPYQLWGIATPELQQQCPGGWAAGKAAAEFLAKLTLNHQVSCEARMITRFGRKVGLCRVNGADIGAGMVSAGRAWADVEQTKEYVVLENAAKEANLGVHLHECATPREYRARNRNSK